MRACLGLSLLTAVLLTAPASTAAQTAAEVTLRIPVNLTQLAPDIQKVRVDCSIYHSSSSNLRKSEEIPVSGGQVVTTTTLQFSFTNLDLSVSRSASIVCSIDGYSTATGWHRFEATSSYPSFRTDHSLYQLKSNFMF